MPHSQQLFTIVDEGGQTLVARSYGDIQAPSFPTLGLLFSIATFSEASGFEMQSVCTQDVQIIYRRFGSLLFIMATNNLLLHADALRRQLEAVCEGLLLLFGAELLAVEKPFQLDRLRKALRGCQALDYFLCEDVTLPSILLPGPQEVSLPPGDASELSSALGRYSQAANTQQAAMLSDGLYLSCTPGWRQLSPRESCLLQIIATHHQPQEDHFTMNVHLNAGMSQPCELVATRVTEGVQLVCICQHAPRFAELGSSIGSLLKPVENIPRVSPYSRGSPNQQLSSLSFDLALIVSHQIPRVILVPGCQQLDGPQSQAGEPDSQHPGMHNSSPPQRPGKRDVRSSGSTAEGDRHQSSLTQQAELMAFMLRCSMQDTGACASAGAHGSIGSASHKAGGQGEIEEEDGGNAENEPGPAAHRSLEAGKGQEIVVENLEDVTCKGGTCLTAVLCSRSPHKATVHVCRSSQGSLNDAIIAAKTLFDLLVCNED